MVASQPLETEPLLILVWVKALNGLIYIISIYHFY